MEKKYIVVGDNQGTGFRVGMVGTAKEFKEDFDDFAQDDMDEVDYENTFKKYEGEQIIELIACVWDIVIEEYTGTDEQEELHKDYLEKYNN